MKTKKPYKPVNTNKKAKPAKMMPMYGANNMPIRQYITAPMNEQALEACKDRIANLIKMVYVLLTLMPTYADSLKELYNQLVGMGMKSDGLGKLGEAMKAMFRAEKEYKMANKCLMEAWEFTDHREEIMEFVQNAYNTISDIVENASKVSSDGRTLSNPKTLLIVEPDAAPEIERMYKRYQKLQEKKAEKEKRLSAV